jgi:hypothetical protein
MRQQLAALTERSDEDFFQIYDLVTAHLGGDDPDQAIFTESSLKVGPQLYQPNRYVMTCVEPIRVHDRTELERKFSAVSAVLHGMQAPELARDWVTANFMREPKLIFGRGQSGAQDVHKIYIVTPSDQRYHTPFYAVLGKRCLHTPVLMALDWIPGQTSVRYKEYQRIHIGSAEDLARYLSDDWIEDCPAKNTLVELLVALF